MDQALSIQVYEIADCVGAKSSQHQFLSLQNDAHGWKWGHTDHAKEVRVKEGKGCQTSAGSRQLQASSASSHLVLWLAVFHNCRRSFSPNSYIELLLSNGFWCSTLSTSSKKLSVVFPHLLCTLSLYFKNARLAVMLSDRMLLANRFIVQKLQAVSLLELALPVCLLRSTVLKVW